MSCGSDTSSPISKDGAFMVTTSDQATQYEMADAHYDIDLRLRSVLSVGTASDGQYAKQTVEGTDVRESTTESWTSILK